MKHIPQPWPSPSDFQGLVRKCEGSFLFATTLISVIDSSDGRFPHQKMEAALRMANGLDPLYAQAISSATRDHHFERVLGTIVVLTRPLAITSLGDLLLLGIDEECSQFYLFPGKTTNPCNYFTRRCGTS